MNKTITTGPAWLGAKEESQEPSLPGPNDPRDWRPEGSASDSEKGGASSCEVCVCGGGGGGYHIHGVIQQLSL